MVREYVGERPACGDGRGRRPRSAAGARGGAAGAGEGGTGAPRGPAAPVLELSEAAEILTHAHLIAGGNHRRKGEYRRARG